MNRVTNRLASLRFRHLQLVELVIGLGTLRKAAQALNITQPSATLMVRELEAVFGTTLFERSRHGMKAAPQTLALLDRVRTILSELELAASSLGAGGAGQMLSVGALPRVMLDFVPQLVQRLYVTWPGLRLRFVEGVASHLMRALQQGDTDCVIARLPHEPLASVSVEDLNAVDLYREGMCLACGPRHPFVSRRRVALADLASQEWILPPAHTEARRVFTDAFLRAGIQPPLARIESVSIISNMRLVRETPFITIAPLAAARAAEKLKLLRVLPVRLEASLSPIAFICRREKADLATIVRMRKIALECAKGPGFGEHSGQS
jgi:DNA-binding transcriptional LysR family regulator